MTITSAGTGTDQQVAGLMLHYFAKVDMREVTYKGAQAANTDLLGGKLDHLSPTPLPRGHSSGAVRLNTT